jgi:hypothetical protein
MASMILERRITLPAGIDDAWLAIVDFASWFCDEARLGDLAPGARVEFFWDGRSRAAVFEDVDAPNFLSFRWLPFERDLAGTPFPRPQARVEIRLEASERDVEVAIVERRLDDARTEAIA